MSQKWDTEGIIAKRVICDSVVKSDNDKYLTEQDIKSIIQNGDSKIEDGTGLFNENDTIYSVINGNVTFYDYNEDEYFSETLDLSSLQKTGNDRYDGMFCSSSIVTFVCDTPELVDGTDMFHRSSSLQSCTLYSDKLKTTKHMFASCGELKNVTMDFSSIENADEMFEGCDNLELSYMKLDNLKSGIDMFKSANLKENNIDIVLSSLQNNNCLETTLDITIDKNAVKYFFDKTGYLPTSTSYTDCYIDGKSFRVALNQDLNSIDELGTFDYIEYDDETNEIISYPTEIFETIEDTSGMFAYHLATPRMTQFSTPMPKVKYTNGMFYSNASLKSFSSDMRNVKEAEWMFYGASMLSSFTSNLYALQDGLCMLREAPITSFNCIMGNLINGQSMFDSCVQLTSFTGNLSKLENAQRMFYGCYNMTTFTTDNLQKLENGTNMFYGCKKLTTFAYNMPKLKNGYRMFYNNIALTTFSGDLSQLQEAYQMFSSTSVMKSFSEDLPSLINGYGMFSNAIVLATFTSAAPNLKDGGGMFQSDVKLTSVPNLTLQNLEDGTNMFYNCTTLATLSSNLNLSKLKHGYNMFGSCKLDGASVKKIYETLPQRQFMGNAAYDRASEYRESGDGEMTIGINVTYSSTASTNLSRLNTFATNAGFASWANMKQSFAAKNWSIYWQYAGSTTYIEV